MSYDSTLETLKHIGEVQKLLSMVSDLLLERAAKHDVSKLEEPEKAIFDVYTPKLKDSTYGSKEYNDFLTEMKAALDHHYSVNTHHPEFFENGIKDMSLISLTEMICDWYAATKRHENGNIIKSIEMNQVRFGYSDELKQIFINTIHVLQRSYVGDSI